MITPPPTGTDTNPYLKSKVLHTFLFGYELPVSIVERIKSFVPFSCIKIVFFSGHVANNDRV